ncbi:alpha/beta hydrolase [Pseudoduganella violaceinigra]|uniref:alpha/beta hydrolase n=1 Tax=Pseudoduganella violaceinigra TaxID=246602 RepID=UPI000423D75F|nr:alpha/beta hydrolase [Pseudoduganella violaceinigra]
MDVITTAVTAGAGEGGVSAAYQMLKSRLSAQSSSVADAIADVEEDPGSRSRQFALSDALASAGLAGDRYLRAAARNLIDEVERRRNARTPATASLDGAPNHAVMKVFFATDRELSGDRHPARLFGAARGQLRYGSCEVSIPRDHRMGELESPSLLRMEFRQDPEQHVVLLSADLAERESYMAELRQAIAASGSRAALLFIHGYRTTFEDAARRTGQLAYDLGFRGAPIFYSWPSQGKLSGYILDEANVEWTQADLSAFLADFLLQCEAEQVYLLAHSMGSRAMAKATASVIAARPELASRIREVILAAPDIDADVFRQQLLPALAPVPSPLTLYASSEDLALHASKAVHGYARAGESGPGLVVAQGVETIDASGMDTGFIHHAYFAEQRSALSDLYYLMQKHTRAAERFGLQAVDGTTGRYWTFRA